MNQSKRRTTNRRASRLGGMIVSVLALALCHPVSVQACAACFGKSDAPMARGMNWGILSLLGVVGMVLGILSSFFVFLAKRAGSVAAASTPAPGSESNNRIKT